MKKEVKSVFVMESGSYKEISFGEFLDCCSTDESYRNKHFIYLSKRLMEVSHDDYVKHYKELERIRNLKRLDIEKGLISMENMDDADSDCISGSDFVAKRAEIAIMMKKLSDCLMHSVRQNGFCSFFVFFIHLRHFFFGKGGRIESAKEMSAQIIKIHKKHSTNRLKSGRMDLY